MSKSLRDHQLRDAYKFGGFTPASTVYGVFGNPMVRVLVLRRRQKNSLWNLFTLAPGLLRSETSFGTRLVLWRASHLPGVECAPGGLPELWKGKAREARVVGRQSLLHQTLCVVGGAAVPGDNDQGSGPGTPIELGHGQRVGEAIHARAVAPSG